MFDRFTETAKRVMNRARQEVVRYRHESLGSEHILLGLLDSHESLGAQLIEKAGGRLNSIRSEIEKRLAPGEAPDLRGPPPFSSGSKKVFEQSLQEAVRLQSTHIGTEHLVLGLLRPKASDIAGDALAQAGITAPLVREIVSQHPGLDEDKGPVIL